MFGNISVYENNMWKKEILCMILYTANLLKYKYRPNSLLNCPFS